MQRARGSETEKGVRKRKREQEAVGVGVNRAGFCSFAL